MSHERTQLVVIKILRVSILVQSEQVARSACTRKSNFLSQQQSLCAIRASRIFVITKYNVDERRKARIPRENRILLLRIRDGRLKVCIFWEIADAQRGGRRRWPLRISEFQNNTRQISRGLHLHIYKRRHTPETSYSPTIIMMYGAVLYHYRRITAAKFRPYFLLSIIWWTLRRLMRALQPSTTPASKRPLRQRPPECYQLSLLTTG